MKTMRRMIVATVLGLGLAPAAQAVSVSLHSSNQGIGSIAVNVVGNTINIEETWTAPGPGVLEISGLAAQANYVVNKKLINNTGSDWTRVANELLDPLGQSNDTQSDILPYPAFVPPGFSTSNDNDGLSFAQGSGIPRTSNVFTSLIVDELADTRDFLDFFNGTIPNGGDGSLSYGLRDNAASGNQPFLLMQRPNAFSRPSDRVPDAGGTLLLLSLGMLGLGAMRRK